jgi:hypothetical protein
VLEALRPQVSGELAESIVAEVSAHAERTVKEWLVASIEAWAAEDFDRYDDQETSCTTRIYHWCEELKRDRGGYYSLYHVAYDGPVLTPDIRLGIRSPKYARKPDITISVGTVNLHIEAKVLRPRPPRGLPLAYVKNGMKRFISGYYPTSERPAMMIGYVMEGAVGTSLDAVNDIIIADEHLGPEHIIKLVERLGRMTELYESAHVTCAIAHFAVDLNKRKQSTAELSDQMTRGGAAGSDSPAQSEQSAT